MATLISLLEQSVQAFGARPALTMRPRYRTIAWSYQDLWRRSLHVAHVLQTHRVKKGDPVLLWAPNSPYWVAAYFGIQRAGAVVVPLNVESPPEVIKRIVDQTGSKLLLKSSAFDASEFHNSPSPPLILRGGTLSVIDIDLVDYSAPTPHFETPPIGEHDLAEIMYTSGTTGDPKGVMLTHANIVANLNAIEQVIRLSSGDRFLSILPLAHIFEQVIGMLLPLKSGAHIVYIPRVASGLIMSAMQEHRVTKLLAVPQFLATVMSKIEARAAQEGRARALERARRIAAHLPLKGRRVLFHKVLHRFGGQLELIASGGAPLDPALEEKWELFGIRVLQGYGLTETSPVVSLNTYRADRLGSVGKPLPGVDVRIAPDGEILVKGPNVFQGYFRNEEKTKEAFSSDRYFLTGDIGEFDQDRFLYIRGRKKYMILGPGGQNVYPEDIEAELNKQPGVRDSTVVGLEKEKGKVEIHAVLLLESGVDPALVVAEANTKLASFQQIQNWSVWPEPDFPRSATRKVKKEEVLRWLRERDIRRTDLRDLGGRSSPYEPTTPLEEIVASVFEIDLQKFTPSTLLVKDLGLDSILRVELISRIEEDLGVRVSEASITPTTTVHDLEQLAERGTSVKPTPPLPKWPRTMLAGMIRDMLQRVFVFPYFRVFVKFSVEGLEHLAALRPPVIFMANHISYIDSVVVPMALPDSWRKRLTIAAAQDVLYEMYRPVSALVTLGFNAFPFERREGKDVSASFEYMGQLLDGGWSVLIYPEGRVSRSGTLEPLKAGAGFAAVEMEAPVVPVHISGTNVVAPPYKIFPRQRGTVLVRFGAPLRFLRGEPYGRATAKIEAALHDLIGSRRL